MRTRKEIISSFYDLNDEDSRTVRSRHGQLEFRQAAAGHLHGAAGKGFDPELRDDSLFHRSIQIFVGGYRSSGNTFDPSEIY